MPRRFPVLATLVLGALALASSGCRRHGAAAAHARYCADNPGTVELLLDGPPDRAYRVIGIVDSPSETSPGRRARNNQIAACRLGADAIVDDAPRGRGLAIQYTDTYDGRGNVATASPSGPNVTVIGPTWAPADETSTDGPIQIQTNGGIEIHAPSVEFREAPPADVVRE